MILLLDRVLVFLFSLFHGTSHTLLRIIDDIKTTYTTLHHSTHCTAHTRTTLHYTTLNYTTHYTLHTTLPILQHALYSTHYIYALHYIHSTLYHTIPHYTTLYRTIPHYTLHTTNTHRRCCWVPLAISTAWMNCCSASHSTGRRK